MEDEEAATEALDAADQEYFPTKKAAKRAEQAEQAEPLQLKNTSLDTLIGELVTEANYFYQEAQHYEDYITPEQAEAEAGPPILR